jgi:hypothetical protein
MAMNKVKPVKARPDIDAATRGGDWSQAMDGEGIPGNSTLEHALYWLMNTQSDEVRREVELTNVPVVVAQAERFRQRLGYWDERVAQLNGHSDHKH